MQELQGAGLSVHRVLDVLLERLTSVVQIPKTRRFGGLSPEQAIRISSNALEISTSLHEVLESQDNI